MPKKNTSKRQGGRRPGRPSGHLSAPAPLSTLCGSSNVAQEFRKAQMSSRQLADELVKPAFLPGPVQDEVERIQTALTSLSDTVDNLFEKLSPLMPPPSDSAAVEEGVKEEECGKSHVSDRLRVILRRVRGTNYRLGRLIDLVEV